MDGAAGKHPSLTLKLVLMGVLHKFEILSWYAAGEEGTALLTSDF